MRILFVVMICVSMLVSCTQKEGVLKSLPATTFVDTLKVRNDIQIVDVRTADEYSRGQFPKAINIDFNANDFKEQINKLDKKIPVFVYCLSGERSKKAAEVFHQEGFEYVVGMEGGLLALNANKTNQPTTSNNSTGTKSTVTPEQFDSVIANEKNVIVDFYADWCGPCKRMSPILEQLAKDHKDKFVLLKVNIDHSREIAMKHKITSIPRLFVYNNAKKVDDVLGFDPNNIEGFKTRLIESYTKK